MKDMNFEPKQWVLVRDNDSEMWVLCQFSHKSPNSDYPYVMCGGTIFTICIPYEGNEHLLGTTDPYVEKYEPKDGDFVYIRCRYDDNSACSFVYIQKGDKGSYNDYYLFSCPATKILEREGERKFHFDCIIEKKRPATEEEKQQLLSKMHEFGKDWNAEKKEVVDWKWMPEKDDIYFFPNLNRLRVEFITEKVLWESMDDYFDKAHYERGWVFRTKEECQAMCDKLNEAIKEVK